MRLVPVIALVLATALMTAPSARADDTGPVAGKYAPAFELPDLSGNLTRLSDYRGKVVLLAFWSTLCAPCTAELKSLSRLAAVFRKDDVAVLSVSIDASDKSVREFVARNKIDLTVLRDGEKEVFFDLYAGPLLPARYLIDRKGMIVELVSAPRSGDSPDTRELIWKLLEKR